MSEKLHWPTDEDVKRLTPDLSPDQIKEAGRRLLEAAQKHKDVIEMVEGSSRFPDESLKVRYG